MTEADMRRYAANIKHCSNSPEREFVLSNDSMGDAKPRMKFATPDKKAKMMGDLEVGSISDAFILWALATLDYATVETLEMFLKAVHRGNPEYGIPDGYLTISKPAKSPIQARVEQLYRMAFVFRKVFPSADPNKIKMDYKPDDDVYMSLDKMQEEDPRNIIIYGPMPDSTATMNRLIDRRLPIKANMYATSPRMSFAKAACAYVAASVSSKIQARLVGVKEDSFKTLEMGTIELPPVLKYDVMDGNKVKEKYNVCYFPVFFGRMSLYQNEMDEKEMMKIRCDEVVNYLYAMTKGEANKPNPRKTYVVMVCESSDDMDTFTALCESYSRILNYGNIDRIYITSEGAIRTIPDITKTFLKMRRTEEGYVETYLDTPPFVEKRV